MAGMTGNIRKSDFVNPLGVLVNGKSFKLNGNTHEGFDELNNYLKEIIGSNRQAVEKYCDQKYEQIGYTWYELMHEYINTEYDYIVHAIASNYCNYIWDSCCHGGKLDWDDYFGIHAEWESGGYGVKKSRSVRKSTDGIVFTKSACYYLSSALRVDVDRIEAYVMDYDDIDDALDDMSYRSGVNPRDYIGMVDRYYKVEGEDSIVEITRAEAKSLAEEGYWSYSASTRKSQVRKGVIQAQLGMTLGEFFNENKSKNSDSIFGFDCYKVQFENGEKIGDNYTGVPPEYHDCKVTDWHWEDLIDFDMLVVTISCPEGVTKGYSPSYLGFNDMVNKLRNTRNNRNVFKD